MWKLQWAFSRDRWHLREAFNKPIVALAVGAFCTERQSHNLDSSTGRTALMLDLERPSQSWRTLKSRRFPKLEDCGNTIGSSMLRAISAPAFSTLWLLRALNIMIPYIRRGIWKLLLLFIIDGELCSMANSSAQANTECSKYIVPESNVKPVGPCVTSYDYSCNKYICTFPARLTAEYDLTKVARSKARLISSRSLNSDFPSQQQLSHIQSRYELPKHCRSFLKSQTINCSFRT